MGAAGLWRSGEADALPWVMRKFSWGGMGPAACYMEKEEMPFSGISLDSSEGGR